MCEITCLVLLSGRADRYGNGSLKKPVTDRTLYLAGKRTLRCRIDSMGSFMADFRMESIARGLLKLPAVCSAGSPDDIRLDERVRSHRQISRSFIMTIQCIHGNVSFGFRPPYCIQQSPGVTVCGQHTLDGGRA